MDVNSRMDEGEIKMVKKIGNFLKLFVIFFAISFPILCVVPSCSESTEAEPRPTEWKEIKRGTVLDVDPWEDRDTYLAIFVEFEDYWVASSNWVNRRPARGNNGILYERKDSNGKRQYKWTSLEEKRVSVKQKELVAPKIVSTPKPVLEWKSATTDSPPINKTVLVKYKNGITITTAYLNYKKEWKLETDRSSVLGGKTIDEIKEWVIIPD